ncbi:MAG: carbohydrate kinase family protein [Nitrospirota bacterium]|nr:MAG: carbohydrate kinase family protein [Nitrospirota bacterium]
MNILVSGSMAYDRIMDFPDKFSNHILPDKIHILNVCFMIDGLKENFGGTAGNIGYTLSLLGEKPTIISAAGSDFSTYRNWFDKNKIPTDHIRIIESELTAGAYITTDKADNQITAFNPGAMKHSSPFDFSPFKSDDTLAIISPGNLDDMLGFSRTYKDKGIRYIFDPGQSLPAWSSEQIAEMIDGSHIFICNDYELQLTLEKTSFVLDELLHKTGTLIVTKGEEGSEVHTMDNGVAEKIDIPAAKADPIADPTGAGDAYRAGLIKGLLLKGKDIYHAAKMGAVAATYSVENYGTQTFHFDADDFNARFQQAFGGKAY